LHKPVEVVSKLKGKEYVRFSLQDVKKSVRGRDLTVTLHFLRPGELHAEIERLIAYHERLLDQPQRLFSIDDARACVGDYRLAHCLIATLSHWYTWRVRTWDAVIQQLPMPPALGNIASPIYLRLDLYSYVNMHHQGFLDTDTRAQALSALAEIYSLRVADLEYLLVMDSEDEALLVRDAAVPPTAQEVASLYNQWVFEAALFNASNVHFVIDCNAFSKVQPETDALAHTTVVTGVGMVIKRLCYLAHRLGVYYDLAYDERDLVPGTAAPERLHLTLYGPQEVTGAPQQYGMRLARLCRMLLGYTLAKEVRPKKGHILATAIVEAKATIHFLQRAYNFNMDAHLLQLLPASAALDQNTATDASVFDSGIEQLFSAAFVSLASSQGVDGWRLEREPEPLLLASSIFIPDFALTRGSRRIYVEILGFWTPAYRERKIQKLQQLQGRDDLLLAIPIEAKDAFVSIAPYFPIVYYDGQLSVTQVLQMLHSRYDDFAERLERIMLPVVRERVLREGLLPERLCYAVLHCYRRSELAQAAERVVGADILFTPGIGLYSSSWLGQLKQAFIGWLRPMHSATLSEVMQEARKRWFELSMCEDATIEALLAFWPEIQIKRASIFDAVVEIVDEAEFVREDEVAYSEGDVSGKGVKKLVRERRVVTKKRSVVEQEATQEDLWG
jgi:predicted nuclease of restriction endonuclease-like RecB superfamily